MAIYRAKRRTNFTMISNVGLRDEKLSFKAKGLLAYMLSLPDDWVFYESEITKHATDGKQSVRTGLKELEKAGYLVKCQSRNDSGKFSNVDWIVSDEPNLDITKMAPLTENPSTDKPTTENPLAEKPTADNQTLLNTNTTKDLSIPSTNNTNSVRHKYGDNQNVLMTEDEYKKLSEKFPNDLEKRIDNLGYYMASTGKSYKSHYMTIIAWARRDKEKVNSKKKPLDLSDVFDEKDNSNQWARLEERKHANGR